ncbi:MAG TPA: hypothetical protein VLM37_04400, partial [Fibrobacteraceae bacterium]|nr:hypothetical protein [Fibrobacteraceae bacterium]
MRKLFILLIVFSAAISHAELILHVYSPWADSSLVDSAHYVTGAFSDWGKSTSSLMTSEGDGYFVYVIDDEITSDSWYTITIKAGGSTWGASPKVTEVFGQETEVWLIPLTDSTYKISLMPTHSKIVWFKSPWGNKKIPNLIAGTDTLRMHPGDSDHCGWFWGALQDEDTSLTFVYFQKKHTEETLPTTGSVDISAITSGSDSVYIDGTVTTLEASALIGDLGTCFDSNYVIHVLNPWDDDSDLRHLQLMMYISNNRLNNDTMDTDDMDGWYKETLADTLTIRSSDYVIVKQCSTYAQYNNYTQSMEDLFPIGEYEAWLLPSGDSTFRILWNIDLRYITLMSPWDDAVPNLVYNDDTLLMRRLTDTCGWYRRAIYEYTGSWSMHFLEGYGTELYTMSGLEDGDDFVLDSILENNEMVWLRPNPYPAGQPVATTSFPEVLGDCPTRSLAVVVYDWAGETTKDTTVDHDFGGTW